MGKRSVFDLFPIPTAEAAPQVLEVSSTPASQIGVITVIFRKS